MVTSVFQLCSQLDVVVNLAVEDDPVTPIRCRHWLDAGIGQIQDGQTTVAERDAGVESPASQTTGKTSLMNRRSGTSNPRRPDHECPPSCYRLQRVERHALSRAIDPLRPHIRPSAFE